jgi:hypothetical protein
MKQMITQFLRWLAGVSGVSLGAGIAHTYFVECFGPDGQLKWADTIHNLVTTEGLNKYIDACLKTGLASPAWYVSLVKATTTGYAAGDTLASHGGWTEGEPGTDWTGNRITFTPGTIAAGSVDNSGSKAVFPILGSLTIKGALLCSAATGTSGTLLGVGAFSGGDKAVANGDTLSVTVTASLSAV